MTASKSHTVSGLKEGMVKMPQKPDLFLTMVYNSKYKNESILKWLRYPCVLSIGKVSQSVVESSNWSMISLNSMVIILNVSSAPIVMSIM